MNAPGNFGAVDGRRPPSLERVSDRTYHRGLVASLFVGDVLAGAFVLVLTVVSGFSLFEAAGPSTTVPHDFVLYWIVVAVLALLSFGIIWNVRAETRDGRPFPLGTFLFVLSLFPLGFGIAMLTWTKG